MAKRKKKPQDSNQGSKRQHKCEQCILHVSDNEHGDSTALSEVKGTTLARKLSYLHEIRDLRLLETEGSRLRMTEVCQGIPETLETVNVDETGHHRTCYQRFINHIKS